MPTGLRCPQIEQVNQRDTVAGVYTGVEGLGEPALDAPVGRLRDDDREDYAGDAEEDEPVFESSAVPLLLREVDLATEPEESVIRHFLLLLPPASSVRQAVVALPPREACSLDP